MEYILDQLFIGKQSSIKDDDYYVLNDICMYGTRESRENEMVIYEVSIVYTAK